MPPPPPSPTGQERVLGTLVVIVLRAKNLPNRVRIGKQNPYATVTYGLHKKRTPTIERGGQQPEWDAEFRFEILREGLGGEEQVAAEPAALVNSSGGVGPATPSKEGGGGGSRLDKPRPSLVAAPQTTGYPPGKRVLKIACWADDARDPKLIGEGELDIENTIKSGKHDDWVKLERKGRYAGEVYLELTWYSNDPRPVKSARREPSEGSPTRAPSAYGGAGARVEQEDYEDSEQSGTEEWDGGSQVGLSAPGTIPAVDLGVNYPDADLAPLNRSMSAMALSARPPLPQPPPSSIPPSASAYHVHSLSSSQSYQQFAQTHSQSSLSSHMPTPQGSYRHPPAPHADGFSYGIGSYISAPQQQQLYGGYSGNAGEFGAYQAQPHPPPSLSEHQQPLGEFEQLAQQHHASQGYAQASNSSARPPLPQPQYSAPPPPPSTTAYQPYSTAQPSQSQPIQQPSQTPYPQPPLPPIPPSGSAYWQQAPSGPSLPPLPARPSYSTLPHSGSQSTIYAAPLPPQPPQPPAPSSAFSPPPPPPSIVNTFHSYGAPPPTHSPYPPRAPQPPSFVSPPVFSPPPPPPSLRGGFSPAPEQPYPPADYGIASVQSAYAQPAPPVPPVPPSASYYDPLSPPANTYDPSTHANTPHGPNLSPYPPYNQSTPLAAPGEYGAAPPPPAAAASPYAGVSARAPLPQPPASAMGHRPLPGMFGQ
ncbi:hypothetical protein JCM11251_006442 [Rhodosporidiobolus azoricus]